MINPFLVKDTFTLIQAVESIQPPANYLTQTFFPQKVPTENHSWVGVEYKKGKRRLAPYIVRGSRGVNVSRENIQAKMYTAPLVAPRRVVSINDIEQRQFGETPIYSTVTPEQRAAKLIADDLTELTAMVENRKNQMASEILQTGKCTVKGYADDGVLYTEDEISFDWNGLVTPTTPWSSPSANILKDLTDAVEKIGEEAGIFPTLMLCGKNIFDYMLGNSKMKEILGYSNRQNLTMVGFAPRYDSPATRYLGTLNGLGLEMRSYLESYVDENGQTKYFLDPDSVIIAVPGRGKQISGAVTLIEQTAGAKTYSAEYVPHYRIDEDAQQMTLTVYSRFLLVPDVIDDFVCIKTTASA